MPVADVTISLYWDEKRKVWVLHARRQSYFHAVTIRTAGSIDDGELLVLAQRIRDEMESWLF